MLSLIAALSLLAQDKPEVKWAASFKDALAQSAREGKPLVIDAGRKG